MDSVIVPMGTAFVGGVKKTVLICRYLTIEQIVITDMLLDAVYAVLLTTTSCVAGKFLWLAGETATGFVYGRKGGKVKIYLSGG